MNQINNIVFNCAIIYALKNKYSGPRMLINYYINEHRAAENMIKQEGTWS